MSRILAAAALAAAVLLWAAAATLAGEAKADLHQAILPPPDSWETDPAELPDVARCTDLPAERVVPVAESRRRSAEHRLRTVPAVPLTAQAAAMFGALGSGEFKPFLVRAVAKNRNSGTFIVRLCGSTLWVTHGSLGRSVPPSTRVPLVVFLDRKPAAVFIGWTMAQ